MALSKKEEKVVTYRVYSRLAVVLAVVLIALAGVLWTMGSYARSEVSKELSAQKIYFPKKGTPALDPKIYPDLQKYAGQLVDDGPKAKAYANGYIGRHLAEVADGKTYAEVSALARQDPKNQALQAQKESLLQGELLRGTLLGNGWGYWLMGTVAQYAAIVTFVAAVGLLVLAYLFIVRARR